MEWNIEHSDMEIIMANVHVDAYIYHLKSDLTVLHSS